MGALCLWLLAGVAWAQGPASVPAEPRGSPSSAAASVPSSAPDAIHPPLELPVPATGPVVLQPGDGNEAQAGPRARTTEIVGFLVQGRRIDQRVALDDLDTLVMPDGRRLLPLLRVLRALAVTVTEEGQRLSFTPEGAGPVVVDLEARTIQVGQKTRPLDYVEATSQVTQSRDVYVSPETASEILDMELVWNRDLYEYRVQLERELSIWKRARRESLLSKRALFVPPDLPQMHGPAESSEDLVHFLEYSWSPSFTFTPKALPHGTRYSAALPGPRETVYGQVARGQYRLTLSQRSAAWDNLEGYQWDENRVSCNTVEWFEWVYRFPSADLILGDSQFSLGELLLPAANITGVQIAGLWGMDRQSSESRRYQLGQRGLFNRRYVFEGPAVVGAQVDLLINDRVVDSQDIGADPKSPVGFGRYRFEDVQLPGGVLNEVVVRITDPTGRVTTERKEILGSPSLLPRGVAAYTLAAGTQRDRDFAAFRALNPGEPHGFLAGGRLLYGVTDTLTLGAMAAGQTDLFRDQNEWDAGEGERLLPLCSTHAGGSFTWMPTEQLLLWGELDASQGRGEGSYDDLAYRLRGEYFPTRSLSFHLHHLSIGTDYFNGQSLDPSDRRASAAEARWRIDKAWTLRAAAGYAEDNLDGRLTDTRRIDYQSATLETTAIRAVTLRYTLERLSPHGEEPVGFLRVLEAEASPLPDLDLLAKLTRGQDLSFAAADLVSGLKLPGVPADTRGLTLAARLILPQKNSLRVQYSRTPDEEKVSLSHSVELTLGRPLRITSEISRDLETTDSTSRHALSSRAEYLLDDLGDKRIALQATWRDDEVRLVASVALRDVFARDGDRLTRVSSRQVRPQYGAVNGRVFVDYNSNGVLDGGEPGLPDVKVRLGELYAEVTDSRGYYILPGLAGTDQARIFLDMETVPAFYVPTHGTQAAVVKPNTLTVVNLGVAPMIAATGRVEAATPDGNARPLFGVQVSLTDPNTGRFIADSITAEDGTFYLGNLRPGQYDLSVEAKTLPPGVELPEPRRRVSIQGAKEFQVLTIPPFRARPTATTGPK